MTQNSRSNTADAGSPLTSDSLTTGVAFMMAMTVIQRAVGFARTALFCRLLPEHELGQWSLAFSFLMFTAPFSMLGITGSFGRYVEHYQRRGQLRTFFQRTAVAASLLAVTAIGLISLGRQIFSQLVFGDAEHGTLIIAICGALAITILYNYLLEVFVALRRPRISSTMELITSWTFALVGVAVLLLGFGTWGVILSYATGNLLACLFGLVLFRGVWGELRKPVDRLRQRQLWSKLAPFALGLWTVNLISNLFDMIDRYMILHFSGVSSRMAQAMVGQYFSSLAIPLLMVGVGTLLAHLVLPYVTEDWEAGRRREVSARLNLALKLIGMMLATGSVVVLLIAPLLFNVVFAGKYNEGLAVLPWTITFCFWNGMVVMAYNYLYCCERTKLSCISLSAGLVTNVILNAILLPRLGLVGAALATATGSLLNLLMVFGFSARLGMAFDRRVLLITALPLTLSLGPHIAAIVLIAALWACVRSSLVFSAVEREGLERTLQGLLVKVVPRRAIRSSATVA